METWAWLWLATARATCTPADPDIVINELYANPPSGDDGREWVEIRNGGALAADLSGWVVASGTSGWGRSDPFPPGTVLAAGGHLVVGQAEGVDVDVIAPGFTLGNASADADAVQLRDCDDLVADTVVYGAPNDDGWLDDAGRIAASLGPAPPDGQTVGRDPDGMDTDRAGDDLAVLPWPSPGAPNDGPPTTCGGPGSGLVVNEILPDPDGADDGFEWVELFHAGHAVLDLDGWSLEAGTSSPTPRYTWGPGSELGPGERLLVGGAFLPVEGLSLGNASSSADIVRIVDCLGFPADTLVYGSPNADGFLDDSGERATSLAPAPSTGAALQRRADGLDTDRCADDFDLTSSPTPGAPNLEVPAAVCAPSADDIVINEILVDPDGADDGQEWVELYNRSDVDRAIDGWALSIATSAFDDRDVELVGPIPAGGFLLVDDLAGSTLGNGTGADGVRLLDCDDLPLDTVLYGDGPNDERLPDDHGEGVEPYGAPGSGEALARRVDGVDTDQADDWLVVGVPTPGATNVRPPFDGSVAPAGCGPPGPSGCSTAPGSLWPLGILAFLRRPQSLTVRLRPPRFAR